MPSSAPPDHCANCGAAIPRGAHACPECGADERTGWRETSIYDGLDLPEEAFEGEPDSLRRPLRRGLAWPWLVVATILLVALIGGALALFR